MCTKLDNIRSIMTDLNKKYAGLSDKVREELIESSMERKLQYYIALSDLSRDSKAFPFRNFLSIPQGGNNVELVTRELSCAKETLELGEGLAKFTAAVQQALANGWQLGEDLPVLIQSAVQDLVPAIQGVDQLGAELEDVPAFVNSIFVSLSPIPFLFIKKPQQ